MTYPYLQTIQDMEKLFYSRAGNALLGSTDLISPFISKIDAPVTSGTTGVYNAVYGAQAWVNLNMEANTFGVIPKVPWDRSGWRLITARGQTQGEGGVSETAALPDSVKPTFAEVTTLPKTSAVVFENSEKQEFLATDGGDDAYANMAELRTYYAVQHKEEINYQMNVQNGTLASNNFESIDRVTGSYAELNNCTESDESTGYTANDLDIYGLDRDGGATTAADAYVSHNSSVVRTLTDSMLQTLMQNTLTNGASADGQFFQTGYDTWSAINQLYDAQVRYNVIGAATIQPGVNGIKTLEGRGVGTTVATVFNKPLIVSKDTVADTGGVSRIYLLDTSNPEGFDNPRLHVAVAKPTQYFEDGMNKGTPFAVDKFTSKGLYRTMAELRCTFLGAQGKIRDIKS